VKQTKIFAYDHRGIITTDTVPRGTSIPAAYYRDWLQKLGRNMHKNRPDFLGDGPLILYVNAHLHLGKVVVDLLSKYEWEFMIRSVIIPVVFSITKQIQGPEDGSRRNM
jgi:hypothetical protein